jgi:hemolysin III
MSKTSVVKFYSPLEEKINIISHAIGVILSVLALIFLILRAIELGTLLHLVSFSTFGISLIILYLASTFYHSETNPKRRLRLKVFDHAAIYVLIAGSYTPISLISLVDTSGWLIFSIAWSSALAGIVLKLFFTGRFTIISTLLYVLMGWLIVFFYKDLINGLNEGGLFWLFTSGAFYTIGAVLYSIHKLIFNHAIFHVFVLLGSISHFICVYKYVI